MSKQAKTPEELSAARAASGNAERRAQYDADFTADEQREYALKVIGKQAGVDADEAAKIAEELGAEQVTELHDAGREGRVADCRALLGLN